MGKFGKDANEQIELLVRDYKPMEARKSQNKVLTPPPPATSTIASSNDEKQSDESKETPNDVKQSAISGFKSELNALFGVIEGQMEFMQKQEVNVMKIIEASGDHADLLRSAKDKSTETEQELLGSILNMATMNEFLQNIILIENLFNSQYDAKQRALQKNARQKYAPQIGKYEQM